MKSIENVDKRKLAAITAAVTLYIKSGEEMAMAAAPAEAAAPPVVAVGQWGASGRSDQMHQRWLMQNRIFRN